MTLEFRPMRGDEFEGYLDYFIPDYAAEISTNYGMSLVSAQAKAVQEISDDLPQGIATPEHVLLCITEASKIIGYLWYKPDQGTQSVFIHDFCILPSHQRMGNATQALGKFETMLAKDGFKQVKLRVAAENIPAQNLYLKDGFRATGINMVRHIGLD